MGHLPRNGIAEALAQSDIHVTPSRWDEPLGLTTLEGLASGQAVVGSATGGTPELLGGAGRLFPREDPEALADLLEELILDPELRASWGRRARARAESLTWQRTWDEIAVAAGLRPGDRRSALSHRCTFSSCCRSGSTTAMSGPARSPRSRDISHVSSEAEGHRVTVFTPDDGGTLLCRGSPRTPSTRLGTSTTPARAKGVALLWPERDDGRGMTTARTTGQSRGSFGNSMRPFDAIVDRKRPAHGGSARAGSTRGAHRAVAAQQAGGCRGAAVRIDGRAPCKWSR